MAKLQLSLTGISWAMMEDLAQLRSAIQSRMMFLDLYEAQAATQYGCIIPPQARLKSNKYATKTHVSQTVVLFIFWFGSFSSCFLRL